MSEQLASQQQEEGQGTIYEEIPFGVWMCDPDGGLRYASDSFLELIGMSMEEASGFGWTQRIGSDDEDSIKRWKKCVQSQQDWDDEHRIKDQDNVMRTMITRGHAVRDESGRVEQWIGVHLDITKRKQAEQEMERARTLAEAIIETVPESLLVLDDAQRIITANRAFYRKFETRGEETVGRQIYELGNGQWNIPALRRLLQEVLEANDSIEDYVVEHDFPDVGRKVMLVNGRRVRPRPDAKEMILVSIRDVTAARQKEDRLRMIHQTQSVQQERQRLARRLHDDLQQLLIAAQLHVGIVYQSETHEPNREKLEMVLSVMRQAIDASRNLAVELAPPVLLESGLMAALQWLARWVEDMQGLHVDLEVPADVRLNDQDICFLLFDAVRELLLNVVKHAQVTTARVQVEQVADGLRIVVSDNGVGYDPDQTEIDDDPAAGFGLSSLRRRLESIGGTLEIASAPGKGTATTITMQLRQQR